MKPGYKIGIDPGQSTLGLAVLDSENKTRVVATINPKTRGIWRTTAILDRALRRYMYPDTTVAVEKYVIYGTGTPAASAIDVIMMVGALGFMFHKRGLDAQLYKAIDWKKTACKELFKTKEFRNPSESFDKKFSFAAAECICGVRPATDHEADAIGLAYVSALER